MKCAVCGHRKYKCQRCAALEPQALPELEGEEVLVPPPPKLEVNPGSLRALCTVVVGEEAEACFVSSERFLRAYAERCNADFHVLRDYAGAASWQMSAKFGAARLLDFYLQVLHMDADTMPRAGCVDVFSLAGDADFAACDTRTFHQLHRTAVLARYGQFCAKYGYTPMPWYFNCGVWVARSAAQAALGPPNAPVLASHCSEEWLVNARVSALRVRSIDRRANWQNWTDPGFREAPADAILHWSGGGLERIARAEQMREVACRAAASKQLTSTTLAG